MSEETFSPISVRQQIEDLSVGESVCLASRMNQDVATSSEIATVAESLHNKARAAMARAKANTGHTYIGEVGEFRTTRGHNPVVCFLITRMD